MIGNYKILTVTHRNTNLSELGSFVIGYSERHELKQQLQKVKDRFELDELFYLSTCNRVMYFFYKDEEIDSGWIADFFRFINPKFSETEVESLNKNVSFFEADEALHHLFEVAASIDSLVVGEREILRQLRVAYEECHDWELTGDNLRLAMDAAVLNAKKVYAQTRIGEKPVSIVSLAIQKLLQSGLKNDARILMIGAGQTNHLVAKFLQKHNFSNVTVFNRSLEKARQIAGMTGGRAFPLQTLPDYREGFDCLIVCTAATKPLVDDTLYETLLNGESTQKLVIDLSIPHNIANTISTNFDIQYVDVENLRHLATENIAFRKREVRKGKMISRQNLDEFHSVYRERQITRALQHIPKEIKAVKSHAMNKVFKKELENIDENSRDLLERMMAYMEKRCISIPMQAARSTRI